MKLYKHKDYQEYTQAQILKNEKKINHVWVKESELRLLSKRIQKLIPNLLFGICHGVRNATEVMRLRELLKIEIIGTDIAPSANKFKYTIQWDFHDIKPEWVNNVDFIYSNSFDHSYDPEKCLDSWMICLKKNGVCFIHWVSTNQNKIDAADCFGGSIKDYRDLFNKNYKIVEEFGHKGRTIFAVKNCQGKI